MREECFWAALQLVRRRLEAEPAATATLGRRLLAARERLDGRGRRPRPGAPRVAAVYELAARRGGGHARRAAPRPRDATTTLREALGRALRLLNVASGGAVLVGLGRSGRLDQRGAGRRPTSRRGSGTRRPTPTSRLLAVGGICEDAIAGVLSGISASGQAIGVGSSYGAFMAPLGHIAARLHAIGHQARAGRASANRTGR